MIVSVLQMLLIQYVGQVFVDVLLVLPPYCGLMGIISILLPQVDYSFEENGVLKYYLALILVAILFVSLLMLIEYGACGILNKVKVDTGYRQCEEDVDVAKERDEVLNDHEADSFVLKLSSLKKVYGCFKKKTAVKNICFRVPEGQCFGLLGVNGVGKTSVFSLIAGKFSPTSGDALINSFSIVKEKRKAMQNIGYCPQFDALNGMLTGREHLYIYGRIKGYGGTELKEAVKIASMDFGEHADKLSKNYSGGNKRKLSAAIALLGDPQLILMDEPTAGMDPRTRRHLWNRVTDCVKNEQTVIFTSHSMEECEALCQRLCIMVNAELKCIGSIQHLKHRFGAGYIVKLKRGDMKADMDNACSHFESKLPAAKLEQKAGKMIEYHLPTEDVSVGSIFEAVTDFSKKFVLEDFSISQARLEHVFLKFAQQQQTASTDSNGKNV